MALAAWSARLGIRAGELMGNEVDAMICAACGKEERASEGYPCDSCGTFICLICTFGGVNLCRECQAKDEPGDSVPDRGDAVGEGPG